MNEYMWDQEMRFLHSDGCGYFTCTSGPHNTRIGIAKPSVNFPHENDCGVLWIDFTRPVLIERECVIPARDLAGMRRRVVVSHNEAIKVAERFGMSLMCEHFELKIVRR